MFNKSHSACYALISYQTAWLKLHYPEEFLAVLLNNACSAEDAIEIIKDCKAHGIEVFGPDVNKSMADKALRVLALGIKTFDETPEDFAPASLEKNLIYVGLCGMIDPIRPEVKIAIENCR